MSEQDNYVGYDEASRILNVKRQTLYAWVSRKRIPHIRLGPRCIRFSRAELNRWIEASRVQGWSDASGAR
jgi:excisionase family DNA binding protein